MTKRAKDFEGVSSKRAKTNRDIEDLWGDDLDLDESVIDDCFKLATQVIEQKDITCTQLNNVSILPSYSAFKGQRNLFSSTQSAPIANSTERKANGLVRKNSLPIEALFTDDNAEIQIKRLQEQIVAKEGEVAILRSQLCETKKNIESENVKTQKEWVEKLNAKTKEMNAIQSQLQFKDLEILNLKQKINELTKVNNLNAACTQDSAKIEHNWRSFDKPALNAKISPIFENKYPLLLTVPSSIFTFMQQEKYYINNKRNNKQTTLFHSPLSQFVCEDSTPEPDVRNAKLNLSCASSEISLLLRSTGNELEKSGAVLKILNLSLALLHAFLAYLNQVEQSCRTEDLIQADVVYLTQKKSVNISAVSVFEGREMCENEIGINARQSIALLAELLPYNSNLRNCFCENEAIVLDCEYFPVEPKYTTRYLNVLLECVTLIGKLRLSSICVGFLCAVTKLLWSLSSCCSENIVGFFDLFKEIALSRPEINVLLELSTFLKIASRNTAFADRLCTMQRENVLKLNAKEGFFTYRRTSCLFHIISVLYESSLGNLKRDLLLRMAGNLLCFMHNIITFNCPWLYCQERKSCDCLDQLTRLSIELIVSCLDDYKDENDNNKSVKFSQVLSLGARLLHLISFRMSALMDKYITLCARFMETAKRLSECKSSLRNQEEMTKLLENLVLFEEENNETDISSTVFDNVPLWNK